MVIDNAGVIDDSDEPGDGALGFVPDIDSGRRDVDEVIDELEAEWDHPSEEPGADWVTFETFITDADNRNKLLAHGWRLTASRDGAAELVQEAVSKALPVLGTGRRPIGIYIRYLQTTMTRENINQGRRTTRAQAVGDFGDGFDMPNSEEGESFDVVDDSGGLPAGTWLPEARAIGAEALDVILDAIQLLPTRDHKTVLLALGLHPKFLNIQFSQTQIAKLTGTPVDRVKHRWRYALPKLRAHLEQFWNDWKKS